MLYEVITYDKTETSRMELMSDMKTILEDIKLQQTGSETAKAISESYQDIKSVVTGSTTNITVPVAAHDIDRGTSLLNSAYNS